MHHDLREYFLSKAAEYSDLSGDQFLRSHISPQTLHHGYNVS